LAPFLGGNVMKKTLLVSALFAAALSLAAQTGAGGSGAAASFSTGYVLSSFSGTSIDEDGYCRGAVKYSRGVPVEERRVFGGLDDDHTISTASELLAMASVLGIQDVKKEDALKLYAEIAMEGAANSFLGVTGTTHSQVLERLRGKYNFTQAEINGAIRDTVAAVVDEKFNRLRFDINVREKRITYTSELTYDPKTAWFILRYERASVDNDDKEIKAASIEELVTQMARSQDFDQAGLDLVKAEAMAIPGARLNAEAIESIKKVVTTFYANPAEPINYTLLVAVRKLYNNFYEQAIRSNDRSADIFYNAGRAYGDTLGDLNAALSVKVYEAARTAKSVDLPREQQPIFVQTVSAR
jgi:hypothetical protein